jgi:hypothetical protein
MGGAVFNYPGGTVHITNSTFAYNAAIGGAGGSSFNFLKHKTSGKDGFGLGGGIFNYNGTVTVTNSTFSSNTVAKGGGLTDSSTGSDIYNLALVGTATAAINNTIMGQAKTTVEDFTGLAADGTNSTSGIGNLICSYSGFAGTVVSTADPLLDKLGDNAGPTATTPTMALNPGSPAIHAASAVDAPTTDQRGVPRNLYNGGAVDIGAYQTHLVANFVVNDAADETDLNDGTLSLPEAIALANDTLQLGQLSKGEKLQVHPVAGNVSTISFDSSLTNLSGQTITLSTASDSRVGPSAFLINSPVVIEGPTGNNGITLEAAAGTPMRLFDVTSLGNLTLQNLTLQGGTAQGSGAGWGLGGAIYNEGSLTILNSTLTGNTAQGGGTGGSGRGGAVYNQAGTTVINNSTFYGNSAIGGAGGTPGQGLGGGLFNHNGTVTVSNSTFSGNNVAQGDGSTLVAAGRGILNLADGTLTATVSILSTIVGQADSNTDPDATVEDVTGSSSGAGVNQVLDHSGNLIRKYSGFTAKVITADPQLGPLQNNGGPTQTLALPGGSPAIGQGVWSATDQRGVPRPPFTPDIGAYQRTSLHIVVNTTADITDLATDPDMLSLRQAIDLINGTLSTSALDKGQLKLVLGSGSAPDTITFDSSLDGQTLTLSTLGDSSVGPSALLVNSTIFIDGPSGDSGITLSAGQTMRLFDVTSTGNLTLQNLTLQDGMAQGSDGSSGTPNGGAGLGGAIYNQGTLTILDDTFTNNTAQGGAGYGGGVGGAGEGGAIYNFGTATVTNSTFTVNTAAGGTGGTAGKGLGGALFNDNGSILLKFSTISGNTVTNGDGSNGNGGGIYSTAGSRNGLTLYYSIIAQNNTTVNDLLVTSGICNGGQNLIGTMSVPGNGLSSTFTGNPDLATSLGSNGGPTQTLALLPGSPAIGKVRFFNVPTDQRGAARLSPADIGAYQTRPAFNMTVKTTLQTDPTGTLLTLSEAIALANGTLQLSALTNLAPGQVTSATTGIVNTINFASSLTQNSPATITLSSAGEDTAVGPSAFLVDSRIEIEGPSGNYGVTLSAAGSAMRLFYVTSTGNLTLDHLTISGGDTQGGAGSNANKGGEGGGGAGLGGAIYNQGTLTLLDSTLTGNTAQGGAGGSYDKTVSGKGGGGGGGLNGSGGTSPATNYGGNGGGPNYGFGGLGFTGAYNGIGGGEGSGADTDSGGEGAGDVDAIGGGGGGGFGGVPTFSSTGNTYPVGGSGGNGGFGGGGGGGGSASNNTGGDGGAGGFGGGGGAGFVPSGLVSGAGGYGGGAGGGPIPYGGGGGAGMGGAVFNQGGTVVITNSTFTLNQAIGGAGGTGRYGIGDISAGQGGQGLGGGVFNYNGTLTVTHSSFSSDTANHGREIVVLADGNGVAATAEIDISIIGQGDTTVPDLVVNQINQSTLINQAAATVSGASNLITATPTVSNGATYQFTDSRTGDPQLGPLADNGGPVPTLAPAPNSPAIGLGTRSQTITFDSLSPVTFGVGPITLSATSSSGLPVTFSVISGPGGLNGTTLTVTGAGGIVIEADQAGNGDYTAAAPMQQTLVVGQASQTITFGALSPVTYGVGPITLSATSSSGLPVTFSVLSGPGSISGTTLTVTGAGSILVRASQAGNANYQAAPYVLQTDTISQATAIIAISGVSVTYDGAAHAAIGTASGVESPNPADLTNELHLFYSADGGSTFSSNAPVNAGSYEVYFTFDGDTNYQPVSTETDSGQVVAIAKAGPTTIAAAGATVVLGTAGRLTASAMLAGGANETGTLTFTLFDPSGKKVDTETAAVNGNGTYTTPTGYLPDVNGTYQWVAGYSGDANNNSADTAPGSAPEIAVGHGATVAGTTLYLVGGNTSDQISIKPIGHSMTGSTGIVLNAKLNNIHVNNARYPQAFSTIDVVGFGGNDRISMSASLTVATVISEGDGNTQIQIGNGNNSITVGKGSNSIQAGNGANIINAGDGKDSIHLANGNNTVTLGNGKDSIQAGNGADTITAGNGKDTVHLGNGDNTVTLGSGNDTVHVGDGNNVVVTGNGTNTIQAGKGNNLIAGGRGHDQIQAGNGSNILIDGSVQLTQSDDSFAAVLSDWTQNGGSTANVAAIRSRLRVTYNAANVNTLKAGKGLDWFWATYGKDHINQKATDLRN